MPSMLNGKLLFPKDPCEEAAPPHSALADEFQKHQIPDGISRAVTGSFDTA